MKHIWNDAKAFLQTEVPKHSYRMWIEPIEFIKQEGNSVFLSCPNNFSKKRICDQYVGLIESAVSRSSGQPCTIAFEISESNGNGKKPSDDFQQLTLPNMNLRPYGGRLLRRDYTFDQFVVGGNNDFAYSAALSMASHKDLHQNSLFLLSKTGMGKSHLSQAVGHFILSEFPKEKVYYITAEDFANEMIFALRNNSIDKFKEKYRRQCDVLLMEDVHFLTGKERTQVELGLTLEALLNANKKIIFSSCYLPVDIPKLNDKLRSCLAEGIITRIDPPNYRMRIRILQKKTVINGYSIPQEVTCYLASELTESVRQLNSGLIGVAAKSALLGAPIDLKLAESVVKNIVSQHHQITIDVIKKLVCKHYRISLQQIVSKSRKQAVVRPRQIAIYLSRRYTDQPLQAIGKSFNRYHATALYAINTVEREIKQGNPIGQQVKFLSKKLENGKY